MSEENKVIELTDLTIATVSGEDAKDFLQGQLSQDLKLVNDKTALLAAYCSPKGRVIASMIVLKNDAGYLLLTKADNAMAFIQRLRMFVLRAKVDIQIINSKVYGAYDLPVDANENFFETKSFAVNNHNIDGNDVICISAPNLDNTPNRYWLISQQDIATNNDQTIEKWQATDIMVGLPWIIAANQDVYIPQTLNYDLINGVNFTKGCYPGQEVVARSHYRGTIKRRCAYGKVALKNQDIDNNNLVGSDIFNADNPKNPCGRVINAVVYGAELFLLIEVQVSDLDNADFRLQESQGLKIELQSMPYSIS